MKCLILFIFGIYLNLTMSVRAEYHTNTITTPDGVFAFSVDDSPPSNPTIELIAGVTNILIIDTVSYHPVVISTEPNTFDWYGEADPQNINSGPMTVTTPTTGFPTTLYYVCAFHGFYGEIHISGAVSPIPMPNTILEVHVGTNVVMTSTGTSSTWRIVPEFSSNLLSGAWSEVPNYTNSFVNGTNITRFPRLDPICGSKVFLRVSQQPPN